MARGDFGTTVDPFHLPPKTNIKPPSPIYITHLHPQYAVRRRRVVEARLHLLQQRLQPRLERAALPRGGLDGHECMWACGCGSVVSLVSFPPKRTYTCTSRPIPNPLIHPQSQKRIHMPPPRAPKSPIHLHCYATDLRRRLQRRRIEARVHPVPQLVQAGERHAIIRMWM